VVWSGQRWPVFVANEFPPPRRPRRAPIRGKGSPASYLAGECSTLLPQPPGRHESGAPVGLRSAHYTRGNLPARSRTPLSMHQDPSSRCEMSAWLGETCDQADEADPEKVRTQARYARAEVRPLERASARCHSTDVLHVPDAAAGELPGLSCRCQRARAWSDRAAGLDRHTPLDRTRTQRTITAAPAPRRPGTACCGCSRSSPQGRARSP